jgi:hypothetical protein
MQVQLADLDRNLRPAGAACRDLIRESTEVLPAQSVCLQIPLALSEVRLALKVSVPPAADCAFQAGHLIQCCT